MTFETTSQTIKSNLQKIGAQNSTGTVSTSLTINGGTLTVKEAQLKGTSVANIAAFPNTVNVTSFADTVSLGTIPSTTLFDVHVDYVNTKGDVIYAYNGKVPTNYRLIITPEIDSNVYNITNDMKIDQIVTAPVDRAFTVSNK